MNERIVYEALVCHVLPAVANSSRHASSRGVSPRNWEFLCCYMKRLVIRNGAQFKFHLPGCVCAVVCTKTRTPGCSDHTNNQTFVEVSTGRCDRILT